MIDAARPYFTAPGTGVTHRTITAAEVLPPASHSLIVAAWPLEAPGDSLT